MFDIITFGSATRDIFVKSKSFLPVHGSTFVTGKGICLPLGSKIEVENMLFSTGGGGTNTAATFAKQGFKAAYCGMIGDDLAGNAVIEELKKIKIDVGLVVKTKKKPTNHSVFLSYPGVDRTALVYRGASDLLAKNDILWSKIKNSRWFYLAPFSGKLTELTELLVDFAGRHNIKTAFNPGYNQLELSQRTLERILAKIDILILNKEEASSLTNIPYQEHKAIFQKLDQLVKGIVVMTQGNEGAIVSDGQHLYHSSIIKGKVVDRTGAGDSFGSGFVSALLPKKEKKFNSRDIKKATQLATANAAFCLRQIGAKEGLLRQGQSYPKVKVLQTECVKETKMCKIK